MIYYIKVYSLPRSQAMRFDLKRQSHCLSCIFSQKIQFAFVDCSSICKQCLCIYKGSNPHGIENLPCGFCLLGCNPSPYEHHVPWWLRTPVECWKSVLQKRVACIRRMQFKGLGFPNKHFATQNGLCIYEDTACHCYERLLNCKMIFQLLYWAYQIFSGGCRRDRKASSNRR